MSDCKTCVHSAADHVNSEPRVCTVRECGCLGFTPTPSRAPDAPDLLERVERILLNVRDDGSHDGSLALADTGECLSECWDAGEHICSGNDGHRALTVADIRAVVATVRALVASLITRPPVPREGEPGIKWHPRGFAEQLRQKLDPLRSGTGPIILDRVMVESIAACLDDLSSPPRAGDARDGAVGLIAAERERQKSVEGWTEAHDDAHAFHELAKAAACYAFPFVNDMNDRWPFGREWWKPTPNDRVRELVKAGALIVAEIERLQRAAASRGEAPR